jgi:S-adenosylmethionine:tRNA ribosyltransferase-isomerase
MVLPRRNGKIRHCYFYEIVDFLQPGDLLVLNDSRVVSARQWGRKESGGKIELLFLRRLEDNIWEALVRPGRKVKVGDKIEIMADADQASAGNSLWGEVLEIGERGLRLLRLSDETMLGKGGQIPLPPYIHTSLDDPERYQTVYARVKGSVAAPTAGLHFTPELLQRVKEKGVDLALVTLHVGLDSFRPVRTEDLRQHPIHREYGEVGEEAALKLNLAKGEGRRVICVGTTTVRLLEQIALAGNGAQGLKPFKGWINLFILPEFRFRITNALITNFHLPRSTLLMLVSAFAGKELIDRAYQEAIRLGYRFYSFGDAMLIL